ncbi:MAG: metallopeptidase family protein [Planctomycetales bacterium]|nr:metallopeptidase family protein [Planctomycetales bacterium]
MQASLREYFDTLLDQVLARLPSHLHRLLDQAPLIVDDAPSAQLLAELGLEHPDELCGLYHGIPRTEQSVAIPIQPPEAIFLFRQGICRLSGCRVVGENSHELERQIRITLLHEIGHHFGLSEEELEDAGYG